MGLGGRQMLRYYAIADPGDFLVAALHFGSELVLGVSVGNVTIFQVFVSNVTLFQRFRR